MINIDDEENADWLHERFSVCQFFENGEYEYVRRGVSARDAVVAFQHYTQGIGARIGITVRVIITDGGDRTCAEWKFNEGVTFPFKERAA